MPAPKKYSHTLRSNKREPGDEKGDWYFDPGAALIVVAAIVASFQTMTMLPEARAADIADAQTQMLMLATGLVVGIIVTIRQGPGYSVIGIRTGFPHVESVWRLFMYVLGAFIVLMFTNKIISVTFGSLSVLESYGIEEPSMVAFNPMFNIALTAAPVEEAIYSFALVPLFFRVCYGLISPFIRSKLMRDYVASAATMVGVSLLFWVLHLGRYGFSPMHAAMLIINRMVYSLLYLKTRSIGVPMTLHFVHNLLTLI